MDVRGVEQMNEEDIVHFGETFEDENSYSINTTCGVEESGMNFFYTNNKDNVTCLDCLDVLTKP